MTQATDIYTFKVEIQEGRNFGPDVQALACHATFAGIEKVTPYSVGRGEHIWNCTLTWGISKEQFRKLSSLGQNNCKISVSNREGVKQGWFVLDLRSAKLHHYKQDGVWVDLHATKRGDDPQVKVFHSFHEDTLHEQTEANSPPPRSAQHAQPAEAAQEEPATVSKTITESPAAGATAMQTAFVELSPGPQAAMTSIDPEQHQLSSVPSPHQDAAAQTDKGLMVKSEDEGPVRVFALTLDLRSFQGGTKMPMNAASVYVQAVLPPEILEIVVKSGFKLSSKLAPLRTHPAVDVMKGSEVALPNGNATVEFAAGVVGLARVLTREPRISCEVWHKDKFRSDALLGLASIPLSPLLQGAWVDGYAPVYALLAQGSDAGEKIQVGTLRVIIALEDKGALLTTATPQPTAKNATPAVPSHQPDPDAGQPVHLQPQQSNQPVQQNTPEAAVLNPEVRSVTQPAAASAMATADAVHVPLTSTPEYEVAWELEVWKKAEEAKWRAELRDREAQRMAVLEAEWRKREKQRESEMAAMRAEYAALEAKTQQILTEAEDRERKLVVVEEALLRRRRDLEREHASRMAEAETAVRRLQVECEHQLEIERDRNAELVRRVAMLEERLAVSEARCASVETAFADYRDAMRQTPEAQLQRDLAEAKEATRRSEEKAAKATKAKSMYKAQVVRLAEQLAGLHKARQLDERDQLNRQKAQLDTAALRLAAEEQAKYAQGQQQELAALREQLLALKAGVLANVSPDTSPTRRAAPDVRSPDQALGLRTRSRPVMTDLANAPKAAGDAAQKLVQHTGSPPASLTQQQRTAIAMPSILASPAVDPGNSPHLTGRTVNLPTRPVDHEAHANATTQRPVGQQPADASTGSFPVTSSHLHGHVEENKQNHTLEGKDKSSDPQLDRPNATHLDDPEVRRLHQRRRELLSTGVYTDGDSLIMAINTRIQELTGMHVHDAGP